MFLSVCQISLSLSILDTQKKNTFIKTPTLQDKTNKKSKQALKLALQRPKNWVVPLFLLNHLKKI